MDQILIDTSKKVLDTCIKKGGGAAEVFIIKAKNLHIEVENAELDVIKDSCDLSMAIRVLIDQSPGFAYCTDFTDSSIDMLIEQVLTSAKNTDKDPHYIFPSPQKSCATISKDEKLAHIDIKEKILRCQGMEKAAYSTDARIKAARQVSYSDSIAEIYLINSHGIEISFANTTCSTFAMAVAQEGTEAQMSWEMDIQTAYDRLKWDEVAKQAAKKALGLLGARPVSTQKAPIILSPIAAISILGSFASAFYADSVQKGRSLMAGCLGKTVASAQISLIDDGLLPEGLSTVPYDGEGVPARQTKIIENGRLISYLYDTYSAHKDSTTSTGNGVRPSPKSQPQVGPTNMFIEKGNCSEDRLCASVPEGFYVMEIMGAHTINPVSGDFSIGATGHWIEKGEKAYPVRGVTISGNMLDLFRNISGCADNPRFFGHFGSPSILVSEIIIAGDGEGGMSAGGR